MNCLLILISILSFIASVLGEIQAFIYCPIECSAMLNCFIALENQVNLSIIQFFPPKNDEFGKCNCQNVAQYIECLNCYYIKKNIQSISEDNIKSHCARIENPTVLTNTDISSEISINENNNRNNKTPDNDIENNKGILFNINTVFFFFYIIFFIYFSFNLIIQQIFFYKIFI